MSDVSILKIEVDDSEFQRFKAEFAKFQGDAAEMPEAWAATDEQIAKVRKNYEAMLKAAGAQNTAANKTSESTKKTGASAVEWAKSWSTIYRGSRGLATNIAQSTLQLARWRGLTATFSGLIGAGGLFGLNTMAASAARRRSEALGIGSSYGERAAFAVNFGRIGNTDAILAGINAAATDVNKRQPLFSMGVDPTGKNPTQVFTELLPLVKKLVDRTDPSQLGNVIRSYGLDQLGIDTTTAMTIKGLRSSEIDDLVRSNRADAKAFDVPDDIARRWTEFMTTIGKAETQIGATLARNLVNITPGLTHLSENVVKLFDEVTKDPRLAAGLKKVGDTLTEWAEMIGADSVQDRIKRYVKKFDATKRDFDQINKWMNAHAGTLKEALGAVLGARVGAVLGPAGMAAGAVIGGFIGKRGLITGDHERAKAYDRQRAGGAADEGQTLDQRNAERKGLGLPPLTQEQFAKERAQTSSSAGPSAPIQNPNTIRNVTPEEGSWKDGANLFSGGHVPGAQPGQDLVTVTTQSGQRFTVHKDAAPGFKALADDLEKGGYHINSIGGYSNRLKRGGSTLSEHAFGNAVDINPAQNPFHSGVTDMPADINARAEKYGLSWGGAKDPMHFEWRGRKLVQNVETTVPTKADMNRANENAYRSSANPFTKKDPTPSASAPISRGGRRGMASRMAPPRPTVEVHDNTGGASHVEVAPAAPAAPALTPAQMAYRAQLEKQFPLIKNGPAPR